MPPTSTDLGTIIALVPTDFGGMDLHQAAAAVDELNAAVGPHRGGPSSLVAAAVLGGTALFALFALAALAVGAGGAAAAAGGAALTGAGALILASALAPVATPPGTVVGALGVLAEAGGGYGLCEQLVSLESVLMLASEEIHESSFRILNLYRHLEYLYPPAEAPRRPEVGLDPYARLLVEAEVVGTRDEPYYYPQGEYHQGYNTTIGRCPDSLPFGSVPSLGDMGPRYVSTNTLFQERWTEFSSYARRLAKGAREVRTAADNVR